MREETRWWLETAERDLERAKRALSSGDKVSAVFWAQQAAEKALKAILLALRGWFPRTHNIKRLFDELGTNLGLTKDELEAAYGLTKYYHLARRPDIVEGTPDDVISSYEAERAVWIAERIVTAVRDALRQNSRRDPRA